MNTFPELENSHLSSTDKQKLREQFVEMTKLGQDSEVILLKQQVQTKSEAIHRRWKSCYKVYGALTPGTTPQAEWFLTQLECSLERGQEDYMDENCDDFEIGLQLMNEHLNQAKTTN